MHFHYIKITKYFSNLKLLKHQKKEIHYSPSAVARWTSSNVMNINDHTADQYGHFVSYSELE